MQDPYFPKQPPEVSEQEYHDLMSTVEAQRRAEREYVRPQTPITIGPRPTKQDDGVSPAHAILFSIDVCLPTADVQLYSDSAVFAVISAVDSATVGWCPVSDMCRVW